MDTTCSGNERRSQRSPRRSRCKQTIKVAVALMMARWGLAREQAAIEQLTVIKFQLSPYTATVEQEFSAIARRLRMHMLP
eukprot:1374455-Amphidinium_carterae.1